jgi:hypothetical protein
LNVFVAAMKVSVAVFRVAAAAPTTGTVLTAVQNAVSAALSVVSAFRNFNSSVLYLSPRIMCSVALFPSLQLESVSSIVCGLEPVEYIWVAPLARLGSESLGHQAMMTSR